MIIITIINKDEIINSNVMDILGKTFFPPLLLISVVAMVPVELLEV